MGSLGMDVAGHGNVCNASLDVVRGRGCRDGYLAGQPNNGVSNALGLGFIGPHGVAMVQV